MALRRLALRGLVAAAASSAAALTATADLSAAGVPQAFPVLNCVGSSHGEMLMWEVYRTHTRAAARDIGFKHMRGHGLLDDDMSTFLGGRANLFNLFDAMDFLRSVDMRPTFELSFTPAALASDPTSTDM